MAVLTASLFLHVYNMRRKARESSVGQVRFHNAACFVHVPIAMHSYNCRLACVILYCCSCLDTIGYSQRVVNQGENTCLLL
jgi:hypothetical protein